MNSTPVPTPCADAELRECAITLSEHNGILNCFHGTQVCAAGQWSACAGESLSQQVAPDGYAAGSYRLLAYGTAGDCTTNPCDPFCQNFTETPPEPLTAEGEVDNFVWQTGSLSDPDVDVSPALSEPCMSGSDCQANHHCDNVATSGACQHSKCEAGDALVAGCDTCVERVCEADATCCQRGWNCAHDVCETGSRLSSTCDNDNPAGSCVSKVCAINSSCCTSSWSSTCVALANSECGADCGGCGPGEVPSADGSSCYFRNTSNRNWSQAQAACRGRGAGWDLVSIDSSTENSFLHSMVTGDTWIGYNRISGPWVWSGSPTSYVKWASGEPNGGDCARFISGSSTSWYDRECSNTYDSLCEGPPSGSGASPAWGSSCVDLIATECDAACSTESPLDESGRCVAWGPGQTDPACSSDADLAVGIPCGDGIVPICNHGGVAAPAGVTLSYYAPSSAQYPSCTPNPAAAKGTCSATTTPIEPGQCVSVTCPTTGASGLAAADTLVANPDGSISECSCLDNWGLYDDGVTCGAPSCAGTSSEAVLKPVRMFLVVDRSYSMVCHPPDYATTCFGVGPGCTCSGARWDGAVSALKDFFQAKESAGIGVAMDFFPLAAGSGAGDGCAGGATSFPVSSLSSSSACSVAPCANPVVPLGILTDDPSPIDSQEKALLEVIGTTPVSPPNSSSASTPSLPALEGALSWAATEQLANPDETFIVVFVTDGEPSSCLEPGDSFGNTPNTNAALVSLAGTVFQSTGVRTYTLGMEGSNTAVLNQIAAAGGTTSAFVVNGSNSSDISSDLRVALASIAGQKIDCSFPFTPPDDFNPALSEVSYTSESTTVPLTHQDTIADCGAGWHYNDNDNPTRVVLCDSTCATVQADPKASIRVDIPCAPTLEPTTFTETYQATCGDAQQVNWQFLSYETTVPSDGEVRFRVRAAATEAGLVDAVWADVKTATFAEPDCTPWSAVAGCPVDLFNSLPANVNDEFLELELTVAPGTDGQTPSADTWQVSFSCTFNE